MAKNLQTSYTPAEIRAELGRSLIGIYRARSAHREAFGDLHADTGVMGSTEACGRCHVCLEYEGEIWGIKRAMRRFGGRPRYDR